jgi:hypothetical protein
MNEKVMYLYFSPFNPFEGRFIIKLNLRNSGAVAPLRGLGVSHTAL